MCADDDSALLRARVRVPASVIYREFSAETVVLNLERGQYHGLNETASMMLGALVESASVEAAIGRLAAELDAPRAVVERDVLSLCRKLRTRGLIESPTAQ